MLAGPDRSGGELERRRTARAACLDVHDRDAGERERAEHLVARGDARVRSAAERSLEVAPADAGFGECGAHRGDAHVGDRPVLEPAERVDADPCDLDLGAAHGANSHVCTTVPSSSVCNGTIRSAIGRPNV